MPTAQNRRTQVSTLWDEASTAPREWVEEHPLPSTLIAFGIGVGVGVVLGHSLANSLHGGSHAESTMEKFGRQALDALRTAVPDAISRHMPR
jgi:hypothetical protein